MQVQVRRTLRGLVPVLTVAATLLLSADASALLVQKSDEGGPEAEYRVFYPYPSAYTYVDERYVFDDDPLTAFTNDPYVMPIEVVRVSERRTMVQPRMSFVHEMYKSLDHL